MQPWCAVELFSSELFPLPRRLGSSLPFLAAPAMPGSRPWSSTCAQFPAGSRWTSPRLPCFIERKGTSPCRRPFSRAKHPVKACSPRGRRCCPPPPTCRTTRLWRHVESMRSSSVSLPSARALKLPQAGARFLVRRMSDHNEGNVRCVAQLS